MNTLEKRKQLKALLTKAEGLKSQIESEVRRCKHPEWETTYDAEHKPTEYIAGLLPRGSDPEPIVKRGPDEIIPRWKRTCKSCGHEEFTYKTKAVQTAPDFS